MLLKNFPSFSEGLSLRPAPEPIIDPALSTFPFLFGGTFIEAPNKHPHPKDTPPFPFLFGGTFIEALFYSTCALESKNFPSFSEGLSLRRLLGWVRGVGEAENFPSFSEGLSLRQILTTSLLFGSPVFPFLFGGTFIEAQTLDKFGDASLHFPSFSEGLSLRLWWFARPQIMERDFPSFSEGLSLRLFTFDSLDT